VNFANYLFDILLDYYLKFQMMKVEFQIREVWSVIDNTFKSQLKAFYKLLAWRDENMSLFNF